MSREAFSLQHTVSLPITCSLVDVSLIRFCLFAVTGFCPAPSCAECSPVLSRAQSQSGARRRSNGRTRTRPRLSPIRFSSVPTSCSSIRCFQCTVTVQYSNVGACSAVSPIVGPYPEGPFTVQCGGMMAQCV